MRRSILTGLILALAIACGPVTQEAESTVGVTAPDRMSIACASNFTRVDPHFCAYYNTDDSSLGGLIYDNTCRGLGFTGAFGVPVTAQYVSIAGDMIIESTNAIGDRTVSLDLYPDATCVAATGVIAVQGGAREQVATAAFTVLAHVRPVTIQHVPVVNGDGHYKGNQTTGSVVVVRLLGYYD